MLRMLKSYAEVWNYSGGSAQRLHAVSVYLGSTIAIHKCSAILLACRAVKVQKIFTLAIIEMLKTVCANSCYKAF